MTDPAAQHRRSSDGRFFRLDGTITLGHVLTTMAMAIAGTTWALRLENRVDSQEKIIVMQERLTTQQFNAVDARVTSQKHELDNSMGDIKRALERIEDKLEKKANR